LRPCFLPMSATGHRKGQTPLELVAMTLRLGLLHGPQLQILRTLTIRMQRALYRLAKRATILPRQTFLSLSLAVRLSRIYQSRWKDHTQAQWYRLLILLYVLSKAERSGPTTHQVDLPGTIQTPTNHTRLVYGASPGPRLILILQHLVLPFRRPIAVGSGLLLCVETMFGLQLRT